MQYTQFAHIALRCVALRRLQQADEVPNSVVLERAGVPSNYTLLRHRRLRWLCHTQSSGGRWNP